MKKKKQNFHKQNKNYKAKKAKHTNQSESSNNKIEQKQGDSTKEKQNVKSNNKPNKKFYKKPYYRNRNKKNFRDKPKKDIVYEICPICGEKITKPLYAIKDIESEKNAHFECIQKKILKESDIKLQPDEKLYYLGGGSFGIVHEKKYRGKLRMLIRQRIKHEDRK